MGDKRIGVLLFAVFLLLRGEPSAGSPQDLQRGTVTVLELSPEVLQRSMQLQQAGLDALRRSDYPAADEYLHQALELTPSTYSIYNNIGVSCARRLKVDEAAGWFAKSLTLAPHDSCVEANLGLMRWVQRRTVEGFELLQLAASRGCSSVGIHFALGVMQLERGFPREAARYLSKAGRKAFRSRDLYLFIALRQLGKLNAAARSLSAFQRRNPLPLISVPYGK